MSTGNNSIDRMIKVQKQFESEIKGKDIPQREQISMLLKMCTDAELGIRAFDYLEGFLILRKVDMN